MPKIFFVDSGFRNLLLGALSQSPPFSGAGPALEAMVCSALLHNHGLLRKVNFWRTTSGAEVDFVVADAQPRIAAEVKAGEMSTIKVSRGYRSFLEKYKPSRALLINRNLWAEQKIGPCNVEQCLFPFF